MDKIEGLTAEEWYEKALEFYKINDVQSMLEACNNAILLSPNFAKAYNGNGVAKSKLGLYKEAIEDYSKAIQLDPNDRFKYDDRGITKSNLGLYKEAIEDYSKAIQLDPNFVKAYENRGIAKYDLGLYKEAIEDYSKAIELDPNDSLAYGNRGNAKSSLGLKKEAIADYNKAIDLDPNNAIAYNNRGSAKSDLGLIKEAILDYDQAIDLDPNCAKSYYNKIFALKYLVKEGEVEYKQSILPNLMAFCLLFNEKELLEHLRNTINTFKEYNLPAPLLLQEILTKYSNNDKNWVIDPFWQNVIDNCRRPNLFLSDIETDTSLLEDEKVFLTGLVYFLYEHPAKSHASFKALYDKKHQYRTAYYLLASMRAYLRPIDDDFFDGIISGIAPISEGTSLDNYYAALLHISDESFVEALDYLDATDTLFLPALYAKVVCLHELKRNTDAVVKQILDAEQHNFQNLEGGYLKDFDVETYLRFQKNWHSGLQKYAHYQEISGGIYLVLSILSDDTQERGRFHAYQDFLGEHSLTRDYKVNKNYVSKSKTEDLTIPTSYGHPFNKPLNAEEKAAEAALFDAQMEALRLKYVDKIEEFDRISRSNEPEYIEIKIADWVIKREAMMLTEEQVGEILTYFIGKDKITHLQKFYLFKFAELNFQLDAKARTLEKGKYERWLIQYVLKKGTQALIDPLNLTDELKELVGNAIQDNIDSFLEQYELLKYVPYSYFKTNVTHILS